MKLFFQKVLKGNSDLLVGHTTWSGYETMLRILKSYKFNYQMTSKSEYILYCKIKLCSSFAYKLIIVFKFEGLVPATKMTFSSYPGTLLSVDDFYITNQNLTVIETSLDNLNSDLWSYVTSETNLFWIRVLIANRLASSGPEWVKVFSRYNSGT